MSRNPTGRRGKPNIERRASFARFRCSTAEYDAICVAAIRRGITVSDYLRAIVLAHEHVPQTLTPTLQ